MKEKKKKKEKKKRKDKKDESFELKKKIPMEYKRKKLKRILNWI